MSDRERPPSLQVRIDSVSTEVPVLPDALLTTDPRLDDEEGESIHGDTIPPENNKGAASLESSLGTDVGPSVDRVTPQIDIETTDDFFERQTIADPITQSEEGHIEEALRFAERNTSGDTVEEELDLQELQELRSSEPVTAPARPPSDPSTAGQPAAVPPPAPVAAAAAAPPPPPAQPKPETAPRNEISRLETIDQLRRREIAPWWDDFFGDDFLRTEALPSEREIEKICDFLVTRLGLPEASTILDVGCGLGLLAVELTRRGYFVVGLDRSLAMLSRASDEAQSHGFRINFLHGDMREMTFEGAFDAVLCWGTSFGYFDEAGNRLALRRMVDALRPGGQLIIDVVNRDFVMREQPSLAWYNGDGCVVMEETSFSAATARLRVKRTVILEDGRQKESQYSLRLYSCNELSSLLEEEGLRVVELTGHLAHPGVFFNCESSSLVVLAERRSAP